IDARIVYEPVESSKSFKRELDGGPACRRFRQFGRDEFGLGSGCAQLCQEFRGCRRVLVGNNRNRFFSHTFPNNGCANAFGAPSPRTSGAQSPAAPPFISTLLFLTSSPRSYPCKGRNPPSSG